MVWTNEKEKLEKYILVDKLPYTEIGKMYDCTANNIKKVAKKLGIKIEPRRVINPNETFNKKEIIYVKKEITEFKMPQIDLNFKNGKQIGEMGERIAIGELSKYGFDILLPMSDNLPYDFVALYKNKFFKCQVKSSTQTTANESISFKLTSSNWYAKTTHTYNNNDVDVFILCDLKNIFLFTFDELSDRKNVIIQYSLPKNNQKTKINFASDYVISKKRIEEVFKC